MCLEPLAEKGVLWGIPMKKARKPIACHLGKLPEGPQGFVEIGFLGPLFGIAHGMFEKLRRLAWLLIAVLCLQVSDNLFVCNYVGIYIYI